MQKQNPTPESTGKRRRWRPSPATIIATIALIFAITGVAKSAIPNESGYYAACYYIDPDPDFSYMYMIDSDAGDTCDTGSGEVLMTFSQYGVQQEKISQAKFHGVSAEGSLKDVKKRIEAKEFLNSIESISLKGIRFKSKPVVKDIKKGNFKSLGKNLKKLEKGFKKQSKALDKMVDVLAEGERESVGLLETLQGTLDAMNNASKSVIQALE